MVLLVAWAVVAEVLALVLEIHKVVLVLAAK